MLSNCKSSIVHASNCYHMILQTKINWLLILEKDENNLLQLYQAAAAQVLLQSKRMISSAMRTPTRAPTAASRARAPQVAASRRGSHGWPPCA